MATVTMTIEEYEALMDLVRAAGTFPARNMPDSGNLATPNPVKKRRKKSKYSKELGRQIKMLKKKHPRTPVIKLMKRAHRATKKALK